MSDEKKPGSCGGSEQPPEKTGRFAYDGLDRVMHEKARLGILASLASHAEGLLFNDLKRLCSLTDGNLSRHLAVLSEATLVETRKETRDARVQTTYRLTAVGRQRFEDYISVLEKVVADAHAETRAVESEPRSKKGWSPA
jgi:DNA-binding MarR family transcriptional regulator